MEFKKSEIKVTIYGNVYTLTKPTFAQAREAAKKSKDTNAEDSYEVLCAYLSSLGLPKEVVEGMEAEHVLALCEYLSPKKSQ